MKKFQGILWTALLLMVLGVTANADLLLFDNMEAPFDGGTVDLRTPVGVLGGNWRTYPANSTQGGVEANVSGSQVLKSISNSSAGARGCLFNGLSDPINNDEVGVMFLRFYISTDRASNVNAAVGLHTNTGTGAAPAYSVSNFKAGFLLNSGTAVTTDPYDIKTLNGATVLKSGLTRNTWYNAWIVVDNATDTFDLYISQATGPAGAPATPSESDKVGTALPFNTAVTTPLVGCMFYGLPSGTPGTYQAPSAYFDEFWWDGSNGLATNQAHTPTPANGAKVDKTVVNQLTWEGPLTKTDIDGDPNLVSVDQFDLTIYSKLTANVTGTDPNYVGVATLTNVTSPYAIALDYDKTYFWRVDTHITWDSNEFTGTESKSEIIKGADWRFSTLSEYLPPVIANFNSVITTLALLPATVSATISGNSDPLTSVTMTLLTDDAEFPAGANAVFTPNTANTAAPTGSLTTDTAGKYKIKLTATDGRTNVEAFAEVVVYADACAAKKAAPSGWTADYYDRDGNCIVDLDDFALLAAKWLNDNSMKASETYAGSVLYIPQAVFNARIEVETYDPNNPDPNSVSNYPITDTNGIRITDGVLGYTGVGSFIEYMIDVPAIGTYDLYTKSSANASGSILNFGTQATANLYGSTTAYTAKGWNNYTTQKYPKALTFTAAGPTKVRITWAGAAMNLDWFSLDLQP